MAVIAGSAQEVLDPPLTIVWSMPPIRKRSKQTADLAVDTTEAFLQDAGCAINEQHYGFDLHVRLPEALPDPRPDESPMS
jgi:hypothetical protein